MSATNKSLYYNLPVFAENDKPAWLEDFNSAMQTIDKTMKQNDDKATQAKTTADSVSEKIYDYDNVKNTANTAKTNADSALTKADSAQSTANTAVSNATTAQNTAETAQRSAQTAQQTAESAQSVGNSAISKANSNTQEIEKLKNPIISGNPILNYDYIDTSYSGNQIFTTFDKTTRMLYINGEVKVKGVPSSGGVKIFTLPSNIVEELNISISRGISLGAFVTKNSSFASVGGNINTSGDYIVTASSDAQYYTFINAIYTGGWK